MFLLAYRDGVPVMGLPGCVMYAKRTVFDLVLPRIMAGRTTEPGRSGALRRGRTVPELPGVPSPTVDLESEDRMGTNQLNHFDEQGNAVMVDVTDKAERSAAPWRGAAFM